MHSARSSDKRVSIKIARVMVRKSIIVLAAAVVLLYFSIILLMLSPTHLTRNPYYGGAYMNHMFIRQVPAVNWCKELHFRSPPAERVVALASYPGSGNTWLRYLLQQATGIVTGSVYMDGGLRAHGFPAESVTDGSTLLVKTHQFPPTEGHFHSAVLLIRNPRDAILADFNRLHKGHIGTAPRSAFFKKSPDNDKPGEEWSSHVWSQLRVWCALHEWWLRRFPGAVHVLYYEALVAEPRAALTAVLAFLHHNYTEVDIRCALNNKEGIYRRRNRITEYDPFTHDMYLAINDATAKVHKMVADYRMMRKKKEELDRIRNEIDQRTRRDDVSTRITHLT